MLSWMFNTFYMRTCLASSLEKLLSRKGMQVSQLSVVPYIRIAKLFKRKEKIQVFCQLFIRSDLDLVRTRSHSGRRRCPMVSQSSIISFLVLILFLWDEDLSIVFLAVGSVLIILLTPRKLVDLV